MFTKEEESNWKLFYVCKITYNNKSIIAYNAA